jgi:hypothetical protein
VDETASSRSQQLSQQLSQKISQRATARNAPIVFSGVRALYKITASATGYTITDLTGIKSPVSATANDRLRFADTTIALDLDGAAGQAYRLYQAAFSRPPDAAGLTYWIGSLDGGTNLLDVANAFIHSAEFVQLYGNNPSNHDLVVRLYFNILHRGPDPSGLAFWQDILDNHKSDLAHVLIGFSESSENQSGVKALIPNGIPMTESGVTYTPQPAALPVITGGNRPVSVTDLVTLDGSVSQLSSGRLPVYSWTFDSIPFGSNASLTLANTPRPGFIPDRPGNYVVRLTVGDGRQVSNSTTATITALSLQGTTVPGVTPNLNYVYLQSDANDSIGLGKTYTYTQTNSILFLSVFGDTVFVRVTGDENWSGSFVVKNSLKRPEVGSYSPLSGYPTSYDKTVGGINWESESRSCRNLTGDFIINSITYDGNTVSSLDLTFNQTCVGDRGTGLHGRVHWVPADYTSPPGPINPAPAGLWKPATTLPTSGNYAYFQSDAGDIPGLGINVLIQDSITLTDSGNRLGIQIGSSAWTGNFQGMRALSAILPGYYGNLRLYPLHNPVKGGLFITNAGGGTCTSLLGWVAIDSVTYASGKLATIDLRFEQHCNLDTPALRGAIHWVAPPVTTP